MDWNSIFEYRDGHLYHKVSRVGCRKGDRVGTQRPDGYWKLCAKRKQYRVHRVIYEMHNGPISADVDIDHINRDRSDNRIENLRLATRSQNIQNAYNRGTARRGDKWRARILIDEKRITLGTYNTEEEAHQAYVEAKKKYHGVEL